MKDDDHSPRNISRRTALKVGGSGAFTLTGVGLVGASTSDDTVKITVTRNREGPVRQKEVPQSWYDHLQHVEDVLQRVKEKYYSQKGVETIAQIRGEESFSGKHGFQIRVGIDKEEFKGDLPDSKESVPIKTIEAMPTGLGACQGVDDSIDPVLGGVVVEEEAGTSCGGFGSTFTTVYDKVVNANRMLTAGHLFEACSNDITGEAAEQGGLNFGQVDRYDANADWATITPQDKSITDPSKIREGDGDEYEVNAWYTDSGISDLISTGETTYQLGTTTGRTSGTVEANNVSDGFDCVNFEGEGVECDITNAEGDSGGPVYTYNTDGTKAVLVCMYQMFVNHSGATRSCNPDGPCSDSSLKEAPTLRGYSFDDLNENHDLTLT